MKKFLLLLILLTLPLAACNVTIPESEKDIEETKNENQTVVEPDDNITEIPVETPVNPDSGEENPGNNEGENPEQGGDEDPDNNEGENPEQGGEDNPGEEVGPVVPEEKVFNIKAPEFETRKINAIEEVIMDDFFNLGNRVDIKVSISESELRKLQSDYETGHKSEIYRLASKVEIILTNYGTEYRWEYNNVGIRQKGNTSRKEIIDGDGNLNKNHFKLSFDETFDDPEMYDSSFISTYGDTTLSTREFLGLSGLDFKWDKNYDTTHIREIYANYLYRASGIMVQHVGLSTFSLIESDKGNKETSMGLCTVYEPATKSFIKRSLKDGNEYINMSSWDEEKIGTYGVGGVKYGDLYKCIYGADLTNVDNNVGIGNISGTYIPLYDRKTNKNVDYSDTLLKNASKAIRSGNYNEISKYVDLEYLAICEAVGYVVGNPDSMRYNTNNYMVYMRRTDGKMVFIPIDNDRCFGVVKDWNIKDGLMYVGMLDRKNSNDNNTISLLLNTLLSNSSNEAKTLYVEFCNKIKESSWATNDTFNQYFNMAKTSYDDYYFSLSDTSNNYTFENYINNKMKQISPLSEDNSGNNSDSNNSGSTTEYDNIYLVSSINDWGNYSSSDLEKYKLVKIADYTYSITVTVTKIESDGDYFKFKFNNGYNDYSRIDWTLSSDLKTLVMEKGSSARCYGVTIGDTVTITINTNTLEASVVIN